MSDTCCKTVIFCDPHGSIKLYHVTISGDDEDVNACLYIINDASINYNQRKCLDLGFKYWRGPDSHGVTCTKDQAVMFIQEMLGVEVEIKVDKNGI